MRALLAGNWKMNGLRAGLAELTALATQLAHEPAEGDVLICPPHTLVAEAVQKAANSQIAIGGQDCHPLRSGAYTGDVSAEMLKDAGARYVINGHSERRQYHGEKDADVAAKAQAAKRAGLIAIVCIGESEAERDAGRAVEVIATQLRGSVPEIAAAGDLVVAYEPVWAIGTGRTPTLPQIAEIHQVIRGGLVQRFGRDGSAIRILYGGSVKPSNARDILSVRDVNGALVGGASLKAAEFLGIIRAAKAQA